MADNEFHYNDQITTQQNHNLASYSGTLFISCYSIKFLLKCVMLSLQLSSLWMESQLFILYTSGDGLMYTPIFHITAMLGLLPIISLMIFILKCYFAIKYRRMWAVTSYYKLYPLTMVLLLLNLLFHDVPQAILGLLLHHYDVCQNVTFSLLLLCPLQTTLLRLAH